METPPKTCVRAQHLRKAMTRTELALWNCVRGKQLDGLKFRRQHPLGPYILDFYCGLAKLAVEIDGPSHESARGRVRDSVRDAFVREQGIATLRIRLGDPNSEMNLALEAIRSAAKARMERLGMAYPPPHDALPSRAPGPTFRGRYRRGGGFTEDGVVFAFDADLPRTPVRRPVGEAGERSETGGAY